MLQKIKYLSNPFESLSLLHCLFKWNSVESISQYCNIYIYLEVEQYVSMYLLNYLCFSFLTNDFITFYYTNMNKNII